MRAIPHAISPGMVKRGAAVGRGPLNTTGAQAKEHQNVTKTLSCATDLNWHTRELCIALCIIFYRHRPIPHLPPSP